jgi:ATP-dependent DNA helicase DinG
LSDITEQDWLHLFPMTTPRPEQVKVINHVLNEFVNGDKKFAVLECGTGTGKSAIGVTIARFLNERFPATPDFKPGAYFLTTQKVLQEQYVSDFGRTMRSLKSSSNYSCNFYPKQSCEESRKSLKVEPKGSKFFNACTFNCKYRKAKEDFLASAESITNFSYFLIESAFSKELQPRNVLVIDESHNTNDELSKFIEVSVSEKFSTQVLKVDFCESDSQEKVVTWIREVYAPKLSSHLAHVKSVLEKFQSDSVGDKKSILEMLGVVKQVELLQSHLTKINTFLEVYDPENWIMNNIPAEGRAMRKAEFKVIDVSPFSQQYLFSLGQFVVMMSATILGKETFCEMLGIPQEKVAFISIPSPFPIENRPIFFTPIGKMSKEKIDETLPKIAEAVRVILESHPKEKGIIHCHTYKIAQYLKKHVKSRRLMVHDSTNRDEILRKHISSTSPTVLLSPSMTEGVDLRDDASRFQVICKIPYPYLGDKICRKRMKKWTWWYPRETAKTIVQALGRSIRSADDHAISYILDEDWEHFYRKNSTIFPLEIRDAIVR